MRGFQARQQAIAIAEASDVETILTFSLDDDASRREFAGWVADQTGLDVRLASSGEELCRESDIVALATTAANPIVSADWWKGGGGTSTRLVHMHRRVRELDTATIKRARIICDQLEACMAEAGDLQIPVEDGDYAWSDVAGNLGDVVNGDTPGRTSDDEVTLFKSVGLAIQDISCAALVYREAVANGIGQRVQLLRITKNPSFRRKAGNQRWTGETVTRPFRAMKGARASIASRRRMPESWCFSGRNVHPEGDRGGGEPRPLHFSVRGREASGATRAGDAHRTTPYSVKPNGCRQCES